jgi:hypothetical protein
MDILKDQMENINKARANTAAEPSAPSLRSASGEPWARTNACGVAQPPCYVNKIYSQAYCFQYNSACLTD